MTNKEAVGKIINSLKYLSKDTHISRRYVLKVLRDLSKDFISKKLLDRTLGREQNLYTNISCFEMKKVEAIDCPIIQFRMCRTLMKSKLPLPEVIFSRFGASVRNITSVDGMFDFILTTPQQYKTEKKRQQQIKGQVFAYVGTDMHLYIPDEEIYVVDLDLITIKTEDVISCKNDECKSAWDYEFIVPDKMETVVFTEALKIISSTHKAIPQDPNPQGIENG